MTTRAYMLASQSTDRATPPGLFDALWEEVGGFDLDPCAAGHHYTARRVWDAGGTVFVEPGTITNCIVSPGAIAEDGLAQPWHGKVFMNPPYGPTVKLWVAKAVSEVACGNAELVVALLKATTDVQWWHQYVEGIVTPRFIKGRLKFGGTKGPAPFPSAIIVWRRDNLASRPAPAQQEALEL